MHPFPIASIENSNSYTVLMTATFRPSSGEVVVRSPAERISHYKQALDFWVRCTNFNVVFVENSGADLETVFGLRDRFEYLSAPMVKIPAGVNYGYGELAMIDFALERSRTIRSTTHFIKATGRLRFPAVNKVVAQLPPGFLAAIDVRRRPGMLTTLERLYRHRRLTFGATKPFVAMQIMMFQPAYWDRWLRGKYRDMNRDLRLAEDLLLREIYRSIEALPAEEGRQVLLRWPANLEPEGIGAHNGRDYGSLGHKLIAGLRASARVVAPKVWI